MECKSIERSPSRFDNNNFTNIPDLEDVECDPHYPASCTYIIFLQKKQEEILSQLHQEIEMLKHENSDLKFQLHIALNKTGCRCRTDNFSNHSSVNRIHNSKSLEALQNLLDLERDKELEMEKVRVKKLELELESATKMLDEVKWVQVHYENRVQIQELKIEELQKKLFDLKTTELEVIQFQIPPKQCLVTRPTFAKDYQPIRQRSSSITGYRDREIQQRRDSQSVLPDNYKDTVATLPPIQGQVGSNANNSNNLYANNIPSNNSNSVKMMTTRLNRLGNKGVVTSSANATSASTTAATATSTAVIAAASSSKKKAN